jgi:hypothetical protein
VTQDRNYPIAVIQDRLAQHGQDLESIAAVRWLAEVVELLRTEADTVPPPVERIDTIPEYIYPH